MAKITTTIYAVGDIVEGKLVIADNAAFKIATASIKAGQAFYIHIFKEGFALPTVSSYYANTLLPFAYLIYVSQEKQEGLTMQQLDSYLRTLLASRQVSVGSKVQNLPITEDNGDEFEAYVRRLYTHLKKEFNAQPPTMNKSCWIETSID